MRREARPACRRPAPEARWPRPSAARTRRWTVRRPRGRASPRRHGSRPPTSPAPCRGRRPRRRRSPAALASPWLRNLLSASVEVDTVLESRPVVSDVAELGPRDGVGEPARPVEHAGDVLNVAQVESDLAAPADVSLHRFDRESLPRHLRWLREVRQRPAPGIGLKLPESPAGGRSVQEVVIRELRCFRSAWMLGHPHWRSSCPIDGPTCHCAPSRVWLEYCCEPAGAEGSAVRRRLQSSVYIWLLIGP